MKESNSGGPSRRRDTKKTRNRPGGEMLRTIVQKKTVLALIVILIISTALAACTTPTSTPTPTSSASAPQSSSSGDFVEAAQKVLPSVVSIEVQTATSADAGTGWVVDSNGYIVTNNHVVAGGTSVKVVLPDGSSHTATSVKTDPSKDLAVIKIDAQGLPAVTIGDSSKLQLGQPVAIMGNALDMGIRVTVGVISRLGVSINESGGVTLSDGIESDASIDPGDSGGVLITMSGEVVGIPTAGLQAANIDPEGFAYAISTNEAMPTINSLKSQIQ